MTLFICILLLCCQFTLELRVEGGEQRESLTITVQKYAKKKNRYALSNKKATR